MNWSSSLRAPDSVREEWRAAGVGDDLDEHYAAMEADLHVTSDESERNGPNARLAAGLDALGLPWTTIPRNVRDCGDCGPCAVGCRRGAKQSTLRTFLSDASARGAEILDRSEVRKIVLEQGRAAGVVAAVPGGEITVRAPQVALAGGSILSPVVLLRSGIAAATAGRTLHMHPVAAIAALYDEPLAPWSGVPQSVMSDAFAEIDDRWGFRLEAAPTHPGLIASGFPWWSSDDHREVMAQCDRVGAFLAIVRDRNVGRISVARDGGTSIAYQPGAPERELLRRGSVELARVHRAAGARRIIPLVTPPHALARRGAVRPVARGARPAVDLGQPDPAVLGSPDVELPDRDRPSFERGRPGRPGPRRSWPVDHRRLGHAHCERRQPDAVADGAGASHGHADGSGRSAGLKAAGTPAARTIGGPTPTQRSVVDRHRHATMDTPACPGPPASAPASAPSPERVTIRGAPQRWRSTASPNRPGGRTP